MSKSTQEERRHRKNAKKQQDTFVEDDIPDEEKIRLIKETGLFKSLNDAEREQRPSGEKSAEDEGEEDPNFGFTFQAFLYTIPLSAVYTLMDILVHRQYSEDVVFWPFVTRIAKVAPILWIFVYFSNSRVNRPWMQFLMFIGSIACGSYLIYVVNKVSYYGVMRRCPPLATLWVYFVVQLKLVPSILSLVAVYLYFQFGDSNFRI